MSVDFFGFAAQIVRYYFRFICSKFEILNAPQTGAPEAESAITMARLTALGKKAPFPGIYAALGDCSVLSCCLLSLYDLQMRIQVFIY